jgi:hypothetical protein
MLEMADVGLLTAEKTDRDRLLLSQSEHRLIQRYRRMSVHERRQVRRLISQLVNTQDLDE